MDNTFKLNKPIRKMDGTEVSELNLNYDVLTMADLKTANKVAKMINSSGAVDLDASTLSPRLNSDLRTAIAWVAAIKGTPGLMVDDVLQLSLVDALMLSESALSDYLFR